CRHLPSSPTRRSSDLISRSIAASRRRIWNAIYPLGSDYGWSGEVVSAEPLAGTEGAVALRLSWEGREGRPIERTVRITDAVEQRSEEHTSGLQSLTNL